LFHFFFFFYVTYFLLFTVVLYALHHHLNSGDILTRCNNQIRQAKPASKFVWRVLLYFLSIVLLKPVLPPFLLLIVPPTSFLFLFDTINGRYFRNAEHD
jgi:hypothetical protein